jgi:CRISPR type III-A-associated protein Csm2
MPNNNYKGKSTGNDRPPKTIDELADVFVPAIAKILSMERATAPDIKDGVNKINEMLQKNKRATAHQIRNIFDLITEIDPEADGEKNLKKLNMLRPRLAYIGARQANNDGKIVVRVLEKLIVSFTNETNPDIVREKIKGLRYIMESIVAYHKFHSNN